LFIVLLLVHFLKKHEGANMSKFQFWWGNDDPQDRRIFLLAVLFALVINSAVLFLCSEEIAKGQPTIDSGMKLPEMRGILIVTLGWVFCFLSAMGAQIMTKMNLRDNEEASHLAERALMNTMEHAIPSLFLIWLTGMYCNGVTATVFGAVYVLGRFLYPILYGWYGHFTMMVEFSTQLGYVALGLLGVSLAGQIFWSDPVISHFASEWYQPFCVLACWIAFSLVLWNIVGFTIYGTIYSRGLLWKEKFDAEQQEKEGSSM
jgi:hypothetical protein